MSNLAVKRLFDSLAELEGAVTLVKRYFPKESAQYGEVADRIQNYEDVITKQKSLVKALCMHIARENWQEVSRHMRLISGFSATIHEDVKELVMRILAAAGRAELEVLS